MGCDACRFIYMGVLVVDRSVLKRYGSIGRLNGKRCL